MKRALTELLTKYSLSFDREVEIGFYVPYRRAKYILFAHTKNRKNLPFLLLGSEHPGFVSFSFNNQSGFLLVKSENIEKFRPNIEFLRNLIPLFIEFKDADTRLKHFIEVIPQSFKHFTKDENLKGIGNLLNTLFDSSVFFLWFREREPHLFSVVFSCPELSHHFVLSESYDLKGGFYSPETIVNPWFKRLTTNYNVEELYILPFQSNLLIWGFKEKPFPGSISKLEEFITGLLLNLKTGRELQILRDYTDIVLLSTEKVEDLIRNAGEFLYSQGMVREIFVSINMPYQKRVLIYRAGEGTFTVKHKLGIEGVKVELRPLQDNLLLTTLLEERIRGLLLSSLLTQKLKEEENNVLQSLLDISETSTIEDILGYLQQEWNIQHFSAPLIQKKGKGYFLKIGENNISLDEAGILRFMEAFISGLKAQNISLIMENSDLREELDLIISFIARIYPSRSQKSIFELFEKTVRNVFPWINDIFWGIVHPLTGKIDHLLQTSFAISRNDIGEYFKQFIRTGNFKEELEGQSFIGQKIQFDQERISILLVLSRKKEITYIEKTKLNILHILFTQVFHRIEFNIYQKHYSNLSLYFPLKIEVLKQRFIKEGEYLEHLLVPGQQIDVVSLLKDIIRNAQMDIQKKRIQVDLKGNSFVISADEFLLKFALGELLNHLIKNTRITGTISVELSDKHSCIVIENSGIGLSPKEIQSFVNPHISDFSKGSLEGIGKTFKAHNIQVEVQSERGIGNKIELKFP